MWILQPQRAKSRKLADPAPVVQSPAALFNLNIESDASRQHQ
jgi:hypothetical protein